MARPDDGGTLRLVWPQWQGAGTSSVRSLAADGSLTSAQVRRIITDCRAVADVVGFTVAEYFPRQVMHVQRILSGLPLIDDHAPHRSDHAPA